MIIDCDQCGVTIFKVPTGTKMIQCPKCQSRVVIDWKTKRNQQATPFVNRLLDTSGVDYVRVERTTAT